jgi:DMSO reductase family type II enzyme heme b subunit
MGMRQFKIVKKWYLIYTIFVIFMILLPLLNSYAGEGDIGTMVTSKFISGEISDDPNSPLWDQVQSAQFPLFSQVRFEPRWFDGKVRSISVRSINNGDKIAFLLEWEDKTEDKQGDGPKDGVALEFPVGKEKAHFSHASRMEQLPGGKVNLWHWKADSTGIKDMNAEGLGTLAVQQQQDVTGKGVWSSNKWKVVFLRRLENSDVNDAQLQPYEYKDMAFAIWDGSNGEQGAQKTVSSWYYLQVEAPPNRMIYAYSLIAIVVAGLFEFGLIRRLKGAKVVLLFILFIVILNGCIRDKTAKRGRILYAEFCASCHGDKGRGDGFNAIYLDPKPRDHTDSKEVHMAGKDNKHLFDAVSKGGMGIAKSPLMPPFGKTLSENDIWSLVAYMRTLHKNKSEKIILKDEEKTTKKKSVLKVEKINFENPESMSEDISRGERLFKEKYGCYSCHSIGEKGGKVGPPLDRVGFRLNAEWMVRWILNPQAIKPETVMPNYGMRERDVIFIVTYLKSLKGT